MMLNRPMGYNLAGGGRWQISKDLPLLPAGIYVVTANSLCTQVTAAQWEINLR
jgi:hypothetical protein